MLNFLLELLKITVPGVLVFLAAYYVMDKMVKNDERRRYYELKKETAKALSPIRLNAYERYALFLERVNPESLILRVQLPGMKVRDLHMALLSTIREEFEHNVSQQIYISQDLWLVIKNAKESLVQFVNTYSEKVPDDLPAIALSKVLIESYNALENSPIDIALNVLKAEVKAF
ncbi:MAG: hypothetical protein M0P12_07375 [Paludibacteraceae bacterium]|nr:hypothetical protein [Paludibacteraceae bacterium]